MYTDKLQCEREALSWGLFVLFITEFLTILWDHRKETVGKPKFRSLEPGSPPTGNKSGKVKREAEISSLLTFFSFITHSALSLYKVIRIVTIIAKASRNWNNAKK